MLERVSEGNSLIRYFHFIGVRIVDHLISSTIRTELFTGDYYNLQ
ncbi:hypothetical protein LEP1GSC058_2038 [Leptospira fainei serovar Hurstbridge str. BUT 6]|uniref:Uncharacterized protein n=1 Tax=Leptospira fainei serovar Hurstbridge str. BUT 6 TaxID=1193011 RepID=S3UYJ1_9LEPT|nr:hypothetical protein LEP1GSC058_2038 [Leptospira fainei serovar Hurstbridge str. BUT 6]